MTVHGLTRFHTGNVPEGRRLAAWEEHNERSLVGLRADPVGDRPFEGTEHNLTLPRLRLARVTGSPHVVERDAGWIAKYPAGGVVLYFALAGHGRFEHRGGAMVLRPGQALVCDADQPFRRAFTRGLTELVLKVPRAVLRECLGGGLPRPEVFGFDGARSPHGHALAATIAGALRGSAEWDSLERTILDLLPAVFGGPAPDTGHLAAARAFIVARLADPGLSAERIADAVGISERQLSRLFARSGESVPHAVLAARLDAARRTLTDPAEARTPLAEVARRHGITSQAHFSRSYRARFGSTPSRDRRSPTG